MLEDAFRTSVFFVLSTLAQFSLRCLRPKFPDFFAAEKRFVIHIQNKQNTAQQRDVRGGGPSPQGQGRGAFLSVIFLLTPL